MSNDHEVPRDVVEPTAQMLAQIDSFLEAMWLENGLSQNTLDAYRGDLMQFAVLLAPKVSSLYTVNHLQISGVINQEFATLKARSLARKLSTLRRFFQHALRNGNIEEDPSADHVMPKLGKTLPKSLSEQDVEALLEAPDVGSDLGLRDRAMLELLYACGLRVSELISLPLNQIDVQAGVVKIMGKGNKERLVPMGELALQWLQAYIKDARINLLNGQQNAFCFVSKSGRMLTRQAFWQGIKRYAKQAGVDPALSPHTLRHAFATHLINHGADLRSVQLLLGHASLSTTQFYTAVAKARLQALHQQHHPRG